MMNPHGTMASRSNDNEFKKDLWHQGKADNKLLLDAKINRLPNFLSFIIGLVCGFLIIAPFIYLAYQYFALYKFSITVVIIFLVIVWLALMLFSALSNAITAVCVKAWYPEHPQISQVHPGAIFIYELLNPWFALFSVIVIVFFILVGLAA